MRIEITIKRLTVHGRELQSQRGFGEALSRELRSRICQRLLTQSPNQQPLQNGDGSPLRVEGGRLAPIKLSNAARFDSQLARGVAKRLAGVITSHALQRPASVGTQPKPRSPSGNLRGA